MPLALEPNRTFKIILENDKKKPENEQPYFEFRYLSGREWKELVKKAEAIEKSTDGITAIDKVFEVVSFGLMGWKNMIDPKTKKQIPFDPKELERVVTLQEANELLMKFRNQDLEAIDLKNSDLPLDSSSAASAKTAKG